MHIIEEMVLFQNSQPVQHIELDTEKVNLFAEEKNKLSKLIYLQFGDFMSREVSELKAELMFNEIITRNSQGICKQLAAGIVTLPSVLFLLLFSDLIYSYWPKNTAHCFLKIKGCCTHSTFTLWNILDGIHTWKTLIEALFSCPLLHRLSPTG